MSKSLGPGAYELTNGTGIQVTASAAKPSCSAIAYPTALSKPSPVVGSPVKSESSQGGVLPPSRVEKYGG